MGASPSKLLRPTGWNALVAAVLLRRLVQPPRLTSSVADILAYAASLLGGGERLTRAVGDAAGLALLWGVLVWGGVLGRARTMKKAILDAGPGAAASAGVAATGADGRGRTVQRSSGKASASDRAALASPARANAATRTAVAVGAYARRGQAGQGGDGAEDVAPQPETEQRQQAHDEEDDDDDEDEEETETDVDGDYEGEAETKEQSVEQGGPLPHERDGGDKSGRGDGGDGGGSSGELELLHTIDAPRNERGLLVALPEEGTPDRALLRIIRRLARRDNAKWEAGLCSGAVYHGDTAHLETLNQVRCRRR